jgi:hypothetical protein
MGNSLLAVKEKLYQLQLELLQQATGTVRLTHRNES